MNCPEWLKEEEKPMGKFFTERDELYHHDMKDKASKCPGCGVKLNRATGILDNVTPRPGDYAVCTYCGEWVRYEEGLTLRRCTQEDINLLMPHDVEAMKIATETFRKEGWFGKKGPNRRGDA